MIRGVLVPLAILPVSPAFAEVCDKVAGDAWLPEHGPIDAWTWSSGGRVLLIVAASFTVIWLFRAPRLAWLGAVACALLAASHLLGLLLSDDDGPVTRAAIQEGCFSAGVGSAVIGLVLFATLALLYAAVARHRPSSSLSSHRAP